MPGNSLNITENHLFGFSLQKAICNEYEIIPDSDYLIHQFNSLSSEYSHICKSVCKTLFDSIGAHPVKCTTLSKDDRGRVIPYNFILSDNSTLSIRTNINGDKVAPRIVGQAGYPILNDYFSSIYGGEIKDQTDIKKLIVTKIDEVLPIFFDKLFDADHIVLLGFDGENISYSLLNGESSVDISFDKSIFLAENPVRLVALVLVEQLLMHCSR